MNMMILPKNNVMMKMMIDEATTAVSPGNEQRTEWMMRMKMIM